MVIVRPDLFEEGESRRDLLQQKLVGAVVRASRHLLPSRPFAGYLRAGRQGESAASAGEPGVGALTGGNAKPFFTSIPTLCSAQIYIALHHKL
jgi:hypothetical protein